MISSRKWLRAIGHIPGEATLHGKKARLEVAVVMNKVLNPELNPLLGAKNDPEFLWHRGTGRIG